MLRQERTGDVVRLTLDRPDVGNALNGELIERLLQAFTDLARDATVRAVVVTGEGRVFSAGADLGWMKSMKGASYKDNIRDARDSARVFAACWDFPRPVIARVNGPARGGGVGMIAACDFAVASSQASFAFTEVRLGVIPAMISPYVVRKIGAAPARRLFLTGETFGAEGARELGLIDAVAAPEALDDAVDEVLGRLRASAPGAMAAVKSLLAAIEAGDAEAIREETAKRIAQIRTGDEAQEGMAAFLEKRKPRWVR
jgi:methylglutaconyl-CoA hydratase